MTAPAPSLSMQVWTNCLVSLDANGLGTSQCHVLDGLSHSRRLRRLKAQDGLRGLLNRPKKG
eukprot:1400181-Pyramimonas_sp.AAC.1